LVEYGITNFIIDNLLEMQKFNEFKDKVNLKIRISSFD